MDSVAMLGRVVEQTQRVVDGVTPQQLSAPSPCTDWTVRDVINHITSGAQMFALSAEHGAVPEEEIGRLMGADNLGDDYKGAFRAASNKALDVFNQPGVLDKTVTLPFGEMPASTALDIAVVDVADARGRHRPCHRSRDGRPGDARGRARQGQDDDHGRVAPTWHLR